MDRENLPAGTGMLFVFAQEGYHDFWMKNMRFPLDIIWIDKDKEITGIIENAAPCDKDCRSFGVNEKTKYVLEVNAGFVRENNISVGQILTFP